MFQFLVVDELNFFFSLCIGEQEWLGELGLRPVFMYSQVKKVNTQKNIKYFEFLSIQCPYNVDN